MMNRARSAAAIALAGILLAAPATAAAAEYTLERATVTLVAYAPGGAYSLVDWGPIDDLLPVTAGDTTVEIPLWGSSAVLSGSLASGSVLLFTGWDAGEKAHTYRSDRAMVDYGALIVAGTRRYTLEGVSEDNADGFGMFSGNGTPLMAMARAYSGQAATVGMMGVSLGAGEIFPGSVAWQMKHKASAGTQVWGGDMTTPFLIGTSAEAYTPSEDWIHVVSWVPNGDVDVDWKHSVFLKGLGGGTGALLATSSGTINRGAWTPEILDNVSTMVKPFKWDGDQTISAVYPFDYTLTTVGVHGGGFTDDPDAVTAIHGDLHGFTLAPGESIGDPLEGPGSPLDEIGLPGWSEETSATLPGLDELGSEGGAWGGWLSDRLQAVLSPVRALVDNIFWWLDEFGKWGT